MSTFNIRLDQIVCEKPLREPSHDEVQAMADSMAKDGQNVAILVQPTEGRRWKLLDGLLRLKATKSLGWTTIIATESVEAHAHKVFATYVPARGQMDQLAWALELHKLNQGSMETLASLGEKLGVTVDKVQEGLVLARKHLDEVAKAEELGRKMARVERNGDKLCNGTQCFWRKDGVTIHDATCRLASTCTVCGTKGPTDPSYAGMCERCVADSLSCDWCDNEAIAGFAWCEAHESPKSRGMKLCLEPRCKTWISGKSKLWEQESFCRKHAKCSSESFPLHDRDGDPIWIGQYNKVTKMHQMEAGHVLNCIALIERNAEKREHHTGRPKAETLGEMPRYALLVQELKQRDACKLCKGGLLPLETQTDPEDLNHTEWALIYCRCKLGQEREAAARIAEQSKGKSKAAILVLALAFVTALLNAPAASPHVMAFLHSVHERLKAMGLL